MKRFLVLVSCVVVAAMIGGCGSKKSTNPVVADTHGAVVEVGLGNTDLGAGNYAGANQHYHAALDKGTDVDKPRNLAKSVTVE